MKLIQGNRLGGGWKAGMFILAAITMGCFVSSSANAQRLPRGAQQAAMKKQAQGRVQSTVDGSHSDSAIG